MSRQREIHYSTDPIGRNSAMTMNRLSLLSLIVFVLAICPLCVVVNAGKPPPPVAVNKCCRLGEQLERNGQCTVGSMEELWWPRIYMIMKQSFFKPIGDKPIFFKVRELSKPVCASPEILIDSHTMALFSNGSLYLIERGKQINADNFCVDKGMAIICDPKVQHSNEINEQFNRTKIRKCCPQKAIYEPNLSCVSLHDGHEILKRTFLENSTNKLDYRYGFPQCSSNGNDNIAIVGKFIETKFDETTGNLTLTEGVFQPDQYCLEHSNYTGSVNVHVFTCAEYLPASQIETKTESSRFRLSIIGCALLISVVFLIATLASGFMLPTNHHALHWRCQTYYVGCLIVGDILLAIVQLSGNAIQVKSVQCVSIAINVHFFYLVAFFWLNTMCFNIWWTFRDLRPSSLEKVQENVRLRIYQAYAWGAPMLIMAIAIILDCLPNGDFLRPRFGQTRCGFDGDKELLAYFYGPVGFLLFINLLLFASTARQLTCGLWKRDDVKSTTEKAALGRVCMKLVVVMGITWVTDVISWIHVSLNGDHDHALWIVPDLINAFHGVFIFIVVGCQPQVLMAIKRFWCAKMGRVNNNTTNGPQHSSSSQGLPSIGESVTNNTFTNNSYTNSKIPLETVC